MWTPEEAHNVDLLIVSLKYGSLRGALQDIQTIVGENTTVMSLMNGVDSEEIIAEKIDKITYFILLYQGGHHRRKKMDIILIQKQRSGFILENYNNHTKANE